MFKKPYSISFDNSRISVHWNIYQYAHKKTAYIYGRDYHEIFDSNDLSPGPNRGLRRIQLGDPGSSFKPSLSDSINIDLIQHVRPSTRVYISATNKYVSDRFSSKSTATNFLNRTLDSFLDQIRTSSEFGSLCTPDVRKLQDLINRVIHANTCLISLDGYEDSILCATIMNMVGNVPNSSVLLLGPSRYKGFIPAKNIPRPQISEDEILRLYSRSNDTDISSSSRHFDQWAGLSTNPSVVRRGSTRRRKLTLTDANRFFKWEPDGEEEDDIPEQLAGPIQVDVVKGRIVERTSAAETGFDKDEMTACVRHLLNVINDAKEGEYFDNWTPGSKNKLKRIYESLTKRTDVTKLSKQDSLELCMDANAFILSFHSTKDELGPAAIGEMAPVTMHLELLMSHFSAWQTFNAAAKLVEYGHGFSDGYRQALGKVADSIGRLPDSAASDGVKEAMKKASSVTEESTDQELVHASLSVRNVLSGTLKGLSTPVKSAGAGAIKGLEGATQDAVKTGLLAAFGQMRSIMANLAGQQGGLFGWILNAMKRIPWDS